MRVFRRTSPKTMGSPTALGIVEEAIFLLRCTPPAVFARYLLATVPFSVGMVLFWVFMSQSAFAHQYLILGALVLVLLFVWMKVGQTLLARDLRCLLLETEPERWQARRILRAAISQTALHVTSLLVYPIAILLFFPLPWVYGIYQNLTVMETGKLRPLREAIDEATVECRRWPGQHTLILWLASPGAFVFITGLIVVWVPLWRGQATMGDANGLAGYGLALLAVVNLVCLAPTAVLVALNAAGITFMAASLGRGLTGLDTPLLSVPEAILNTTGLAILAAAVFLLMDPLTKAVYVLRCHYGQAVHTGQDLRLRLRKVSRHLSVAALGGLAVVAWALLASPALAQTEAARPGIAPEALRSAIQAESASARYAWRMPRDREWVNDESWFARNILRPLMAFKEKIAESLKWFGDLIGDLLDWIFDRSMPHGAGGALSFRSAARISLVALAVVLVAVLLYFLQRNWRTWRADEVRLTEAVPAAPNLEDEDTLADALPENEWLRMAREMAAQGDFRLAARALFLALLAGLAEGGYVTIARHKSNRDYALELRSRALQEGPDVAKAFAESSRVFETIWYGQHEARQDHLDLIWGHEERVRGHGR